MAEVPDHLVPTDGLTKSMIEYAGFDVDRTTGGASHRFNMRDEEGDRVGTFTVYTRPTAEGSVDQMVAEAHRKMVNVLRQWLHVTDDLRKLYER